MRPAFLYLRWPHLYAAAVLSLSACTTSLQSPLTIEATLEQIQQRHDRLVADSCRLARQRWPGDMSATDIIEVNWRLWDEAEIPGDFAGLVSLSYEHEADRLRRNLTALGHLQQERARLCHTLTPATQTDACRTSPFKFPADCPK